MVGRPIETTETNLGSEWAKERQCVGGKRVKNKQQMNGEGAVIGQ